MLRAMLLLSKCFFWGYFDPGRIRREDTKINNFQGDLNDISAVTKPLVERTYSILQLQIIRYNLDGSRAVKLDSKLI